MSWSDIMGLISKAPEAGALKVHLEAAWKESDELKEKLGKLAEELTVLTKENRELRNENSAIKAELASFDHKAILVDIGPCLLKRNKQGQFLPGEYCHKCHEPLKPGQYHDYKSYFCERCLTYIKATDIESAKDKFNKQTTANDTSDS